jgi:N utilization substance protein B
LSTEPAGTRPEDAPAAATGAGRRQAAGKPKAPSAVAARRLAREFALQGLYQWLLSGAGTAEIVAHLREQARDPLREGHELQDFAQCDRAHFDALLHGCIEHAAALDAALTRHIDRPSAQLSPIEHAALMIGAYELQFCIEVPYRVALNEAVELAKAYGGTDGHKYVNGVLDRVAADLRPEEVARARARR